MSKFLTARQLAEELMKNPDDIVCTYDAYLLSTIPVSIPANPRFKGEIIDELFRVTPTAQKVTIPAVISNPAGDQSFFKIL